MKSKFIKLLANPLEVLRNLISSFLSPYRYRTRTDYDTEKYWTDRHSEYGLFDLRGVGCAGLSHDENEQMYLEARGVFLEICRQEGVDFKRIRILDVGCGNGFYAKVLFENGAKQYLGVDITDVLFSQSKQGFSESNFQFRKFDICTQELDGNFDLIIMIDVSQHIVDEDKFSFAMQNIRSHLSKDGVFMLTSWLGDKVVHRTFYEVARPMNEYEKEFPGWVFGKPVPFRDKFMFSIKRALESSHHAVESQM